MADEVARSFGTIEETLTERELEFDRRGDEHVIVQLPGVRKLKTTCLLTVSVHGVRIEAFVCRHPDENEPAVHQYLLQRNRKLYGVAYTIDRSGDIYLVGRMAHHAVTADELDRLLGQVLEAADGDFNVLLEIGFISSIRREWAWRTSRGEPLDNLKAFEHLIKTGDGNGSKASDTEEGAGAKPGGGQGARD
ncbi:type III secretion system chaperone family protein [Hoyosella subflava]|uniref:YbjN domain-containing protein n=1 Tax=Hoyosella subflava (strain DSM 45089 / JCM 17490 / NBRC 109087 / DQS3-9A1) TaxID=443218 RepID=F6EJN0_HOYSD|nr:YbjN domain-containing protein [Hoyosella subflava]AEF39079.1 hypothetical protein AS9A_0625 [Hoyosella subflava DQS3-9A1]